MQDDEVTKHYLVLFPSPEAEAKLRAAARKLSQTLTGSEDHACSNPHLTVHYFSLPSLSGLSLAESLNSHLEMPSRITLITLPLDNLVLFWGMGKEQFSFCWTVKRSGSFLALYNNLDRLLRKGGAVARDFGPGDQIPHIAAVGSFEAERFASMNQRYLAIAKSLRLPGDITMNRLTLTRFDGDGFTTLEEWNLR